MSLYKRTPFRKQDGLHVASRFHSLIELLWSQRKSILISFLVIVAVLFLSWGYGAYRRHQNRRAWQLLDQKPWGESRDVAERFSRLDAGVIAKMALADGFIEKGDWAQAIPIYQELISLPDRQSLIRVAAIQNLSLIYSQQGDWENALSYLKRAEGDPANPVPDLPLLLRAYLLQKKGDVEEAKKILESLSKEAVDPSIRQEAETRLKWVQE